MLTWYSFYLGRETSKWTIMSWLPFFLAETIVYEWNADLVIDTIVKSGVCAQVLPCIRLLYLFFVIAKFWMFSQDWIGLLIAP